MPLRNAERNPLIEFIPVGIFWRRVHDADQLVFIASFFVEKRGRMFRIEAHPRLESVPVIREVILLLRQRVERFYSRRRARHGSLCISRRMIGRFSEHYTPCPY